MVNFLNVDNLEFMKSKPDGFYDLAIVDPPYGIDYLHSGGLGTNCKNKKHNRKWHDRKNWDKSIPDKTYFDELFRVSKNQIVFGGNYFTEYLPPKMGWIFWDKGQDLSMSDGELVFTSFDKALRRIIMNRGQLMAEGGTIHPTQKPIKLYRWILQNYAEKGMKLLDTHGGSMSIAIAADMEGFDIDIIEIDTEYFQNATNRFNNYKRQLKLF